MYQINSLLQSLTHSISSPSLKYYSIALAYSRTQYPTFQILSQLLLLIAQDKKWLQVLYRLSLTDFSTVFHHCINYPNTYVVLLKQTREEIHCMFPLIKQVLYSASSDTISILNMWVAIKMHPTETLLLLQQYFVDNHLTLVSYKAQYLQCNITPNDYVASFQDFQCHFIALYKYCRAIALKKIKYFAFRMQFAYLQKCLKQLINDQILSITKEDKAINAVMSLIVVSQIKRECNVNALVQFMNTTSIEYKSNCFDDVINYEYGLIDYQFGEDVTSLRAKLIIQIAKEIDGALTLFLSGGQTKEYCLKILLLHLTLQERTDLIDQYILPKIKEWINNQDQQQSQTQLCRKIRIIAVFRQQLPSSCLQICIDQCIKHLLSVSIQMRKESHNILTMLFEETTHKRSRIKSVIHFIPYLCQKFTDSLNYLILQRSNKQYIFNSNNQESSILSLLNIMHLILGHINPKNYNALVQALSQLITQQRNALQLQNQSNSPILNESINVFRQLICSMDEDDIFFNMQTIIPMLSLQRIEYQDQQLKMISTVVNKLKELSPDLCLILTSIPYNRQIYFSLCQKQLSNNIMFNWEHLPFVVVKKAISHAQTVSPHYYQKQYAQIIHIIICVLISYEPLYLQNQAFKQEISIFASTIAIKQVQMQLTLTVSHIQFKIIHTQNNYLHSQLQFQYTVRIIYVYFCDALLHNFSLLLLQQFIHFHKEVGFNKKYKKCILDETSFGKIILKNYISECLTSLKMKKCIDGVDYAIYCNILKFENIKETMIIENALE